MPAALRGGGLGCPGQPLLAAAPRAGQGRLRGPGATAGPRYQRDTPGELVHLDTKALDRLTAVGHRVHGNRSRIGRRRGLGQDHLHVAIDDATRLADAELHPAQDAATCARFLEQAHRWAYKRPYRTSTDRKAALPDFLDSYNLERPHRALGRVPLLLHFLMQREQRV